LYLHKVSNKNYKLKLINKELITLVWLIKANNN